MTSYKKHDGKAPPSSCTAKNVPKIAQFCDWSPGFAIQSYTPRDETGGTAVSSDNSSFVKGVKLRTLGIMSPCFSGRMFLKSHKNSPTKGEQKIIAGIMENRGDEMKERLCHCRDSPCLLSHSDAWRHGYTCTECRASQRTASRHSTPPGEDNSSGSQVEWSLRPQTTCLTPCDTRCNYSWEERNGMIVPRISQLPPALAGKLKKYSKVPPISCKKGGVYVQKVNSNQGNLDGTENRRIRTFLDVFLPRPPVTSDSPDDKSVLRMSTCPSQSPS